MRVQFSSSKIPKRHFICFMDDLNDGAKNYYPYIKEVEKLLKSMFKSVEFINDVAVMFYINDDSDEAHFLLWSHNNEIII